MASHDCTPLDALIQLNGHARAYGCGKHAIYAYKTLIACKLAAERALLNVRLLKHDAKCRSCMGTGIYHDWYDGRKMGYCYKCSAGKVTLRFVETTLPNGHIWHHPFNQGGAEIAKFADVYVWAGERYVYRVNGAEQPEEWHTATDWQPNQPADRFDPEKAATLLNIVEPWVIEIGQQSGPWRWQAEAALREMRGYRIDLGRVGDTCWYCDSKEISIGLGRMQEFHWAAPVCKEHSEIPVGCWPSALPESVLTPPLREWLARHRSIGFEKGWS